jgi:hypothetical protein
MIDKMVSDTLQRERRGSARGGHFRRRECDGPMVESGERPSKAVSGWLGGGKEGKGSRICGWVRSP